LSYYWVLSPFSSRQHANREATQREKRHGEI
jgi:hypothetical protein